MAYWEELQLIRKWTKTNHNSIHQATMEAVGAGAVERFWKEHNFVFRRGGTYLHGAGRNWSRTEHMRRLGTMTADEALLAETDGLDVRFYSGKVDASELPSSYKPARAVVEQIESYGLAEIEDWIDPYGSIMAGEMPRFTRRPRGVR